MFDHYRYSRTKFHLFSFLCFALIISIIIFSDSFIANISSKSIVLQIKINSLQPLKPSLANRPLFSKKEETNDEVYLKEEVEDHAHLVPPYNLTHQERISWFMKKLPNFGILKSTKISRQFHNRVSEFFTRDCSVQFFMTWISPTKYFGKREFFTLESLFKAHPKGCLIILSKTLDPPSGTMILRPLVELGYRILVVTPDLYFLFENTPAESWFVDLKNGKKDPGKLPLAQNLSNLIRLVVLYKYGGVYLDTDFIILKDFSRLRNSIGAQSMDANGNWTRLNNALLIFDKSHPLVYKFMEEFALNFDGNRWGQNGPYLVSRVVEKEVISMKIKDYNFTILPPRAFYPVYWIRIGGLFLKFNAKNDSKWLEAKVLQLSQKTHGVHLWNSQGSSMKIEQGSIIHRLVSTHCLICKDI
ncbi:LOW QUALITY PROTEIN: uncharacterized protein LOC132058448 [Lycium ferocissimum]|uniref:LOW QUALITY PROTEIN: uncharacterized protein LOC132058448 n=1 Tax=Lycium ferocissimum TaxID=112874 RepID=UPI002815B24E|nr:LOW QUALITY PROTEIN: uncharacterized protein LOC132058448 [Lycium ferocissimum]